MKFLVKQIREVEDKFILNEKQMGDVSLEYLRNLLYKFISDKMNFKGDYSFYVDEDKNIHFSDSYSYHKDEYLYYKIIGKIPDDIKCIHDTILLLEKQY